MQARKEYVWGYGTGVVAATDPHYGDVVLAEYTQPFNETDPTYYRPLIRGRWTRWGFDPKTSPPMRRLMPRYFYQDAAEGGRIAAIPLNTTAGKRRHNWGRTGLI